MIPDNQRVQTTTNDIYQPTWAMAPGFTSTPFHYSRISQLRVVLRTGKYTCHISVGHLTRSVWSNLWWMFVHMHLKMHLEYKLLTKVKICQSNLQIASWGSSFGLNTFLKMMKPKAMQQTGPSPRIVAFCFNTKGSAPVPKTQHRTPWAFVPSVIVAGYNHNSPKVLTSAWDIIHHTSYIISHPNIVAKNHVFFSHKTIIRPTDSGEQLATMDAWNPTVGLCCGHVTRRCGAPNLAFTKTVVLESAKCF